MTVLIAGGNGQLGRCLQDRLQVSGIDFMSVGRKEMDITDISEVSKTIEKLTPSIVVNAAAYNDVEKSETEKRNAILVNELGTHNLANLCKQSGIPLIHISTDYVFDGTATEPYKTQDLVNPQCFYGLSKLKGEITIEENCDSYLIIRTSWLFSEYGNNFLKTILRLGQASDTLEVVSDQVGCPTYAGHLAQAILDALQKILRRDFENGIYHYAGDEHCSWYEFAQEILLAAQTSGLLRKLPIIDHLVSDKYPAVAKRPVYSVLDSSKFCEMFDVEPSNWRGVLPFVVNRAVV